MTIEMIAFDADDTLWQMEIVFIKAQEKLSQSLLKWCDTESILETIYKIETGNIVHYGYGVKSYTLSLIEAALVISDGEVPGTIIEEILNFGKEMLDTKLPLIPGVKETLDKLVKDYPLMVITKGDLLEQTTKLDRSGLANYFSIVEVLSDKSQRRYANLINKLKINPETFVMVGNSLRSDIQPVLSLGGIGIHIPGNTTWAHELLDDFDSEQKNFYELDNILELPELLEKIS
jgi:putative hydrolase of the HAD superfamily